MPEMMRAIVVFNENDVRIVNDVPMPVVGPYDCLLKIRACGFCSGTDFHIIRSEMTMPVDPFPSILGHEGVAEIVQTGNRVRNYKVGDRFLNPPEIKTTEKYGNVFGHMRDYSILQDQKAMREDGLPENEFFNQDICIQLPDDFDVLDAGVLLTLSECLSAAKNFRVENKDVLVYGAGPMGLATMKYMRQLGAKTITCIDCVDERLHLAKTLSGADQTINFKTEDKEDILKGRLFDRVIDIVGSSAILLEGSQLLRPYGVLGSMGVLKNGDSVIDASRLKNNTLLQMLNFPYGQYDAVPENIALIRQGVINPKDFYSHVRKPEEIQEVLELVRSRTATKVVIDFD